MFGFDDGPSSNHRDLGTASLALAGDSGVDILTSLGAVQHRSEFALASHADDSATTSESDWLIRTCDIAIASAALLVVLPLLVLIALLVFVCDPGPVFFAHRRVGEGGRHFHCLKFRSMVRDADARLRHLLVHDENARLEWETYHKLSDDPRILPLGRFLRKSSLDELPQLLNVLRGDMSIVGPRPIVPDETWRYGRYLRHYLNCRPGITGLWQISGRSNTTYRRRVALDVTWSRSRSLTFYWWVLFRTVPSVLTADGSA